jgi:Arc/MetJ-type ribon-helix-helix transcriptional regulator
MATTKLTVTLPDEQLTTIRQLVSTGQVASISAFVKRAVDIALADATAWDLALQQALEATGGPLTPEERAWADSVLAPPKPKRPSRRRSAA